ncbi:MAG: hypothetical protein JNL58_32210, partial [Planctomyces sp.]|nr:hypothetical protein [Planctomyces sp.]
IIIGRTETRSGYAWGVPGKKIPVVDVIPDAAGPFSTDSLPRKIGCSVWLLLLSLGTLSLFSLRGFLQLQFTLVLTLCSQMGVHLFYGGDPFLYCIHFAPPLILVAAMGSKSRFRWAVRILVATLIVCASMENFTAYESVTNFLVENHVAP